MTTKTADMLLALSDVWAIVPERLAQLCGEQAASADMTVTVELESRANVPRVKGSVAVLPLHGTIMQRAGWWPGTSTDGFSAAFAAAVSNQDIKGIVIDADTPGGSVYGVDELSRQIYEARGAKPVMAVANSMAASAGYWIASSASKLFVAPGGDVGSIGVIGMHEDLSGMLEKIGVKTTLVTAGKYKGEAHPFAPLSDEGRTEMQARVDGYYEEFTEAVARNRNTSASSVKKGFGQGRLVPARGSQAAGMTDGVKSLSKVLEQMGVTSRSNRAASEDEQIAASLASCWKHAMALEHEEENCGDPDLLRRKLKLKHG